MAFTLIPSGLNIYCDSGFCCGHIYIEDGRKPEIVIELNPVLKDEADLIEFNKSVSEAMGIINEAKEMAERC